MSGRKTAAPAAAARLQTGAAGWSAPQGGFEAKKQPAGPDAPPAGGTEQRQAAGTESSAPQGGSGAERSAPAAPSGRAAHSTGREGGRSAPPLYRTSTVHCHSTCCDGRASLRQMAGAALAAGVKTLGFSGHGYVCFDPPYSMSGESTAAYRREILALRAEYAGRMEILCGVEWDLYSTAAPGVPDALPAALLPALAEDAGEAAGAGSAALPHAAGEAPGGRFFDYVIGSAHYIRGANGVYYAVDGAPDDFERCIRELFGGDGLALAEQYYRNVACTAARIRPDILGHFDLVKKLNQNGRYFDEQAPRYLAAAEAALQAARAAGCRLEINTGGVYRGYGSEYYPSPALLRRWRALGGQVVITADAHTADALLFDFDKAAAYARAAGFEQVQVLTARGFVSCAL